MTKVYLPFENYKRDFLSRLFLGLKILKKKNINQIEIGWHKAIFYSCLQDIKKNKFGNVIIDSNNFDYKYHFIKFLKFFDFKYYVLDEEEVGGLYIKDKKVIQWRFPSKKFAKLIDRKFKFNKELLNKEKRYLKINNLSLIDTGNPRIQLLKKILNSKIKKRKSNNIFVALPEGHFWAFKLVYRFKKGKLHHRADRPMSEIYPRYKEMKEMIRLIKNIAIKNTKYNFIVRPHPVDAEHLGKYKLIFKKNKNVSVTTRGDTKLLILDSKMIICGYDFVGLEGHFLKKKGIIVGNITGLYDNHFIKNLNGYHYSNNFIKIKKIIKKILSNKRKTKISENLIKKFYYNVNSCEIISQNIEEGKKINDYSKKFIKFFSSNFFRVFEKLKSKKINQINLNDYSRIKYLYYNFYNFVLSIFFGRSLFFSAFKTIFFINKGDHSLRRISGIDQKIEEKDLKRFNFLLKNQNVKYKISGDKFSLKVKKTNRS